MYYFCSVLGHASIPENRAADTAAKAAATDGSQPCDQTIVTDICAYLHCAIYSVWQNKWTRTQQEAARCKTYNMGVAVFL
jgi:ribonuclease HI